MPSIKSWILEKAGYAVNKNENNFNYRTIEEEMIAQYSKTKNDKKFIKETETEIPVFQGKLEELYVLSHSTWNLNSLDAITLEKTKSKYLESIACVKNESPAVGHEKEKKKDQDISIPVEKPLVIETPILILSEHISPIDQPEVKKHDEPFATPSGENGEESAHKLGPNLLYNVDARERKESFRRRSAFNVVENSAIENVSSLIQAARERKSIALPFSMGESPAAPNENPVNSILNESDSSPENPLPISNDQTENPILKDNIDSVTQNVMSLTAMAIDDASKVPTESVISPRSSKRFSFSLPLIYSKQQNELKDTEQDTVKQNGIEEAEENEENEQEEIEQDFAITGLSGMKAMKASEIVRLRSLNSLRDGSSGTSLNEGSSRDSVTDFKITEDPNDEDNVKKAFEFLLPEKSKFLRRIHIISFLKAVIEAYKVKKETPPFQDSIFRLRDIADTWFSVTSGDEIEGMDLQAFKLLVNQISDVLQYIKMVIKRRINIERDTNIWEEQISYDVNLVIDESGKVLGATLGSLIEKLTSSPIKEVPIVRTVAPKQDEKSTPAKRRRAKSDAPLRKKNSHSEDFSAPKKTSDRFLLKVDDLSVNPAFHDPSDNNNTTIANNEVKVPAFPAISELAPTGVDGLAELRKIFFTIYREFATPSQLFKKLLQRFNFPEHIDRKEGLEIQNHVVSLMVYWVENHPSDFKEQLLAQVTDFIDAVTVIDLDPPKLHEEVEELTVAQENMYSAMCDKMIHEITLRNRKSKINMYQHVFSGLDMVMWVIKHVPGHKNIRKGLIFGVNATELGLIDPIVRGAPFIPTKTSYYHYRKLKTDLKNNICLNLVFSEPDFFNSFRIYAKKVNYEVHVNFLCRVEYFKDQNPDTQLTLAKDIFDTYLAKVVKIKVTNDDKLIRAVDSILRQNSVDSHLFDDIRELVYWEVDQKCFSSFKQTKQCEELIKVIYGDETFYHECPPYYNHIPTVCYLDIPEAKVPDILFESASTYANQSNITKGRELAPGIDFKDIDEIEIARQLALASFEIFSKIERSEFLCQAWTKTDEYLAPNLIDFIDRFNSESVFASLSILGNAKVKARAKVMEKFIKIAWHSLSIRNFSTMVAIISALSSAPINRLKFTKAQLSKQAAVMLAEMESFFSSSNNFKTYRDAISEGLVEGYDQATIPHMALFLQDLTFIHDGNPSTVKGIINFEQKMQVYQVIDQISKMQKKPYIFFKVIPLWHLLKKLPYATEKQLYKMSLSCEPRGADSSQII